MHHTEVFQSREGALLWCRASGAHPVPRTWTPGAPAPPHVLPSPLPVCHTDPSRCLCAAAKPPLEPPSEIKAPLEGEALLRWVPCRVGSHAHRASFLLQITSAAETEAVTSQKLVKGHAYSVTGAEEVRSPPRRGETQPALRVAWAVAATNPSSMLQILQSRPFCRIRF